MDRRLSLLLLALRAHLATLSAGAWGVGGEGCGSAHNRVRDIIGFALLGVIGVADSEFRLNDAGAKKLLDSLISGLLLQLKNRMERRTFGRRTASTSSGICAGLMLLLAFS